MNHRHLAFAALLASVLGACASNPEPRYAGTAKANSRGVIAPGQTTVASRQVQSPFGTPSNIPETIRAPAVAQPAFATPVDMDALYGYDGQGRLGMAEGDPSKAEFNFERALEVNPFDAVALNNLAVAKAERGQFYEAMSLLERAAKLAPDNSEVIANLARLRGYVQSYATAGVEAGPAAAKGFTGVLPPEPPPLWGSYDPALRNPAAYQSNKELVAPVFESGAASGDYYNSDACRRIPLKGGKVDVVCEPVR